MFWISAANTWCSKYRNKALEKRIKTGVHSPGMFRSLYFVILKTKIIKYILFFYIGFKDLSPIAGSLQKTSSVLLDPE